MKKLLWLTMFLITITMAFASAQKPQQESDPFNGLSIAGLSIAPSPMSIMGQPCTVLYATQGDYCSGQLRIYYQCLPTLDGGQWEQRTEDCESYGGRCTDISGTAKCVDYPFSTPFSWKVVAFAAVFIIVGILIIIYIPSTITYVIGALAILIGIWLIMKILVGGV